MMPAFWVICMAIPVLAGCTSAPDPPAAGGTDSVITDPRDTAYLQAAEPGSHVHDYWEGRTQVTVVEDSSNIALSNCGDDHCAIGFFLPPEGTIVPQGTGRLQAVADWEDSEQSAVAQALGMGTAYTRVELWVRTAADGQALPVGTLEKGVPLTFNSTNEQDDPPHYVVSLWEFHLVFWNDGSDSTTFSGTMDLKVEAFRTLPLVAFPPHRDQWNGSLELVLHESQGRAQQTHAVLTYACTGGCLPSFGPADGIVVPFDAREVVVSFIPGAGATPVPVSLDFHGADTRTHATIQGQPLAEGVLFTIPIQAGMADSPYALQSLWEFRIRLDTPEGQGHWQGDYRVQAKALR